MQAVTWTLRLGVWCAAIVSLFNVADTISDGEVQLRLRNQYGEVLRVWPHPGMRGCRLVEFFDTRVAAAVRLLRRDLLTCSSPQRKYV